MMPTGRWVRGVIQQATETADNHGEPRPTWSTFDTRWMTIAPLRGRERFQAQQIDASVDHRILMRYRSDKALTAKMRISWNSRLFHILAIINHGERNDYLEVLATEEVS